MVQHSRMDQTSVEKIPFDWRVLSLSLFCLQHLAVAQNHPGSNGAGLEERTRDETVAIDFLPASNSTSCSYDNCEISLEQSVTSEHTLKPTEQDDRTNVHRCPVCEKTFQYKAKLLCHLNSHSTSRNSKCSLCSNAYKYPEHLSRHVKEKHPNEFTGRTRTSRKQVQQSHEAGNPCPECNKLFKTWNCLQQHQRLIHKGTELSVCEECGKTFTQMKTLNRHIRTVHKKLGRSICAQCGKSLRCSFALKRHMKILHQFTPMD
ncbi:hypothetical protein CSKR_108198 [Clonorchis sinensis]|uniref:C2H2-type domain-containing protein n=1 Tax=Clonorchis sinensis TaxID=79923 RepID=A0A3R7CCU8_CLOSI|nr:hypothetical protein CSKR_108198 [Clonorchis sinensis]